MAACLALWSLGMILARSCAWTAVAAAWAPLTREKFSTLRERLRDLYREGSAKAGARRCTLHLDACGAQIRAAWVRQESLPFGTGKPEPWPDVPPRDRAASANQPQERKNLQL